MEECDEDVLKNEEIISNIKGFYKNDAVALVVSTHEINPELPSGPCDYMCYQHGGQNY